MDSYNICMMASFRSTSFYLSQWANKEDEPPESVRMKPLLLDIVESTDTREVCKGQMCALYYNMKSKEYESFGNCIRKTLCTETRIIRDAYFIKTGSVAETLNSINHADQLNNW